MPWVKHILEIILFEYFSNECLIENSLLDNKIAIIKFEFIYSAIAIVYEVSDAIDFIFVGQVKVKQVGPGPKTNVFVSMDANYDGSEWPVSENDVVVDHIVMIICCYGTCPIISQHDATPCLFETLHPTHVHCIRVVTEVSFWLQFIEWNFVRTDFGCLLIKVLAFDGWYVLLGTGHDQIA